MGKYKKNLLQNMALLTLFAILFYITLLPLANALNAISSSSPLQSISRFVTPQPPPLQQQQPLPQPPQTPQQNQQVVSPPQFPQIAWDELEEAEGFIAMGKIDSTLYTINGNWKATGDWNMNVSNGEVSSFNTTMTWHNGTSGHGHEFLNFETTDDVDISAEDQTISIEGTMDVGTNRAVSWEDVPSEIVIEGGRIIRVSVDDEATGEHFSGQSVHGNVTSLSICSTTPGPAMQVFPGC
jgi:hypothetical protein